MKRYDGITASDLPDAKDVIRRAISTLAHKPLSKKWEVLAMFKGITVAEFTEGRSISLRLQ